MSTGRFLSKPTIPSSDFTEHRTRLLESIISVPAQPSPPMLAVLPVQVRVSVSVAVSEKLETFAADYKLSHPGFGLEDRMNSKFKMFWSKF